MSGMRRVLSGGPWADLDVKGANFIRDVPAGTYPMEDGSQYVVTKSGFLGIAAATIVAKYNSEGAVEVTMKVKNGDKLDGTISMKRGDEGKWLSNGAGVLYNEPRDFIRAFTHAYGKLLSPDQQKMSREVPTFTYAPGYDPKSKSSTPDAGSSSRPK